MPAPRLGATRRAATSLPPHSRYSQDHDALVRQLIDETKAALRDAVARRAQVVDAARAFDAAVASKFGEAAALLAKLKELHAAKEGVEATCRELREQLRVALEAAATAKTHEEEANGEIDEANVVIAERDRVIEELRGEVSSLESQMGELDAINKGLEDDKEMLTARVKQLQTQVDAATSGHASAVEAAKLASAGIAAAATARATALAAERDDLTSQLAAGSKRVAVSGPHRDEAPCRRAGCVIAGHPARAGAGARDQPRIYRVGSHAVRAGRGSGGQGAPAGRPIADQGAHR